jgi:catalase
MLNTVDELHPDERYKFGSKEKELAEFADHARRVTEAQMVIAARNASLPNRVFHMKTHGCLSGVLRLLPDRPESVRHGIFANSAKSAYNVLARFSSGVGVAQHDLKPDVRGLALKIFGVDDRPDKPGTIDFLMTNSPNPFGSDQEEFVRFMEANVDPGILGANLLQFLVRHPDVARLLVKATLKVVPSLATEQYWSGHAYLLGPEQAMKFNVRPVIDDITQVDSEVQDEIGAFDATRESSGESLSERIALWVRLREAGRSKLHPDYLSLELRRRLSGASIKFILSAQLAKGNHLTPVEDGLVAWKESDSPSIPLAELSLDRLLEADACANLRFTPGHFIPEHRPLGNLGRGRIFTYRASQDGRGASNEEPSEQALQRP